jgi:hypothetical protein
MRDLTVVATSVVRVVKRLWLPLLLLLALLAILSVRHCHSSPPIEYECLPDQPKCGPGEGPGYPTSLVGRARLMKAGSKNMPE